MTKEQSNLINQIRTMRTTFETNCDTMRDGVKALINDMIKEYVDSVHTTTIFHVTDRDMWRTTIYIKKGDGNKQRKFLSAKTKDELYQKLYEHYAGPGTLANIHEMWLEDERNESGVAPSTLLREKQRWNRYFSNSKLVKQRIDEIDHFMLEKYVSRLMKKFPITKKELREIIFLLTSVFFYAERHDLIPVNPMKLVKFKKTGCAPTPPKEDEARIFLLDELTAFQREIDAELKICPWSTTALGIRLLIITGIRVGEEVALRKSDIDFERKVVTIKRMEQKADKGYEIVDHTKSKSSAGFRELPLSEEGIEVINQILAINEKYGFHDDDFLFLGEKGQRIHERAIDNRIRKLCKRANIAPAKSAHDIRRTYATTLYRNTLDIELVRKNLGHSSVNTTWDYIVLLDKKKEDHERTLDAIKSLYQTASNNGTEEQDSKNNTETA